MKKFFYFTKITHITKKKHIPVSFSTNLVLVPISFFPEMSSQKKSFGSKKNQLFTKQVVSPKEKQFIYLASQKLQLLKTHNSFLCTISGGQDSIFTFFLLLHNKKMDSLKIIYCQHFWQIKNFFSARLIFQVSYLFDVPYTLILPQKLFDSENESRDWRKKNFCRFSQLEYILTTLTGHTETDNLEKNLNNLFRGTSPAGLSSLNILNAPNRVELFFSTIKFTSYFRTKHEKRRIFSQKFLFQNLKNNRIFPLSPTYFSNLDSIVPNVTLNSFQNLQDLRQISEQELKLSFAENFFQYDKYLISCKRYIGNTRVLMSSIQIEKFCYSCRKNTIGLKFVQFAERRRSTFQFFKPLNSFSYLPIFSLKLGQHHRHFLNQIPLISKTVFNRIPVFYEITKQSGLICLKKNTNTTKVAPISKRLKSFRFFEDTKVSSQNKMNESSSLNFEKFGLQTKSFSFCFSNKVLKLQVNLFKPLKHIKRFSVSKFLTLYNLPLILDVTNFSYIFSRNKIRHQILPFIRSLINLNVEKLIINFFTMISQQNQEIEKEIQELDFIFKILTLQFVKSTEVVLYSNLRNSSTVSRRLKSKKLSRKILAEKKLANVHVHNKDHLKLKEFKNNLSASSVNMDVLQNVEPKTSFLVDDRVNKYLLKILHKTNSELQNRSLLQKFFFDYKNMNLNYSQILKLQDFYSIQNKTTV